MAYCFCQIDGKISCSSFLSDALQSDTYDCLLLQLLMVWPPITAMAVEERILPTGERSIQKWQFQGT